MQVIARHLHSGKLSVRLGIATVDQGIASMSNFAVGVAVARVAGLRAFGAYSLVYACWVILAGLHRSLITDPMNIENDIHATEASRNIRLGLASELFLGLIGGVVAVMAGLVLLAVHQHLYGSCFLALAAFLPVLLAQDYWRLVAFMKGKPQQALANDTVFLALQAVIFVNFVGFGSRSPDAAIAAWGLGALGGAVYGLWQHRVMPSLHGGARRIQERLHYSKWLVGTNVIESATAQSTLVLTGAFLGPAGIGGIKSALNLVAGPSMVVIQAVGGVGLPEATKQLALRGWPGLRRVQRWVTAMSAATVGILLVVVLIDGRQLLALIYGQQFAKFAVVADIVAASLFVSTFTLGPIMCLKATRQTRLQAPVSAAALLATVAGVINLAPGFGVVGAAWANMIGNATKTVGLLIVHWTRSRKAAEEMVRVAALGDPSAIATGALRASRPMSETGPRHRAARVQRSPSCVAAPSHQGTAVTADRP